MQENTYYGTTTGVDLEEGDTGRLLYHVVYDDGDKEDLYAKQVKEGMQLYQAEQRKGKKAAKSRNKRKPHKHKPPIPIGTRKHGCWGCAECGWMPKGCNTCQNIDYISKHPKPLPKGMVCGEFQPSHQLKTAFQIVSDVRQSDRNGYGIIATRLIAKGEIFEDNTCSYISKPSAYAKAHLGAEDYIAHGTRGYFLVREPLLGHCAFSNFLNMAGYTDAQKAKGQKANIKWTKKAGGRIGLPSLNWVAVVDIEQGAEILVDYTL